MNSELDPRDSKLLRELQEDFPLTERPYAEIAERMGWTEKDVISRIETLTTSGIVRKLGAVLNPRKMGYVSVLAAMDVPDDRLSETASLVNKFDSVTHNYLRDGNPNLWFTMTEPDQDTLERHLQDIEVSLGLPIIRMPVTKMFKIGVKLDI